MAKTFFKQLKKDLKNKEEHKKAFYFLFLFIAFFTFFYLIFSTLFYTYIIYFYGYVSSVILKLIFNIPNSFIFDNINYLSLITVSNIKEPIIISFLCSGIIEFCLLASAILASKGIDLNKRIIGFLFTIPVVVFFNIFRIVLTILLIVTSSLAIAEFMHGFLFRIFLVIVVIGFYYFWFKYSYKWYTMPRNVHKSNPINILPEKNRKIFTDVIPTLRKIQEKKYFQDLYRETQNKKVKEYYVKRIIAKLNSFFEERHSRTSTNKNKEAALRIQDLTKKNQRDIRSFILEQLNELDLNVDESKLYSDLERIKLDTRSFIKKNNKTEREFTKESAIKKILEDIDYYDYLHPSQRQKVLDLINYQLALLSKEKKITTAQFEDLKKEVLKIIARKIDSSYALENKAKTELKQEILSSDLIKRELKDSTPLEKQEILAKLNSLILEHYGTKKGNVYDILREYIIQRYK